MGREKFIAAGLLASAPLAGFVLTVEDYYKARATRQNFIECSDPDNGYALEYGLTGDVVGVQEGGTTIEGQPTEPNGACNILAFSQDMQEYADAQSDSSRADAPFHPLVQSDVAAHEAGERVGRWTLYGALIGGLGAAAVLAVGSSRRSGLLNE